MKQNHDGLLSAYQKNRLLRRDGYHTLMFLLGNALLIAPSRGNLLSMSTGSLLLLLGVELLFVFSFGWSAALITADLWNGKVSRVEGNVWTHSHRIRGGRSYFYIADAHRFQVTQAACAALVAGRPYRIFYAPRSKRLVSIEPLA